MDILGQLLQGATGGQGGQSSGVDVGALASQFGLSPDQANAAVGALLPAVLGGIKKAEQGGVLDQVANIANGTQAPVQDVSAGNNILGQIFGSKDVSRQVAAQASAQTGISDTILKAMLPIVAGLVAQQVAKKMGGGAMGGIAGAVLGSLVGGGAAAGGGGLGGGLGGIGDILGGFLGGGQPAQQVQAPAAPGGFDLGGLASMLDRDGDGNPLDDIIGMVNRK